MFAVSGLQLGYGPSVSDLVLEYGDGGVQVHEKLFHPFLIGRELNVSSFLSISSSSPLRSSASLAILWTVFDIESRTGKKTQKSDASVTWRIEQKQRMIAADKDGVD
jgi:hypothetical protein